MKHILLGIFRKQEDADSALVELGDSEFVTDEISVVAREDKMKRYKREDAGKATVTGGILGGIAGLLIAAAPVVIPGVGILVAGPLVALTGLALGELTGGLLGALVDAGLSESQARSYEKRIQQGEVLLGIQVDDTNETKARDVLEKHHAEELVLVPYGEKTKTTGRSTYAGGYAVAGAKGGKAGKRK